MSSSNESCRWVTCPEDGETHVLEVRSIRVPLSVGRPEPWVPGGAVECSRFDGPPCGCSKRCLL